MLNWKRAGSSWRGNGFVIRKLAPSHWVVTETHSNEGGLVSAEPDVLADLPTLASAKYAAESLHDRRALASKRGRLGGVAVGAFCLAALAVSNPIVTILAAVVGTAAILELAMTYAEHRVGRMSEFVQ